MNIVAQRSFPEPEEAAVEIRVRGRVQGVGFRPNVWRIATELGLGGEVLNDAEGVLIRARGGAATISAFVERIRQEPPPLAAIESVETRAFAGDLSADFRIVESVGGTARTQISPDAAICPACAAEVLDPSERRHHYPFTNCTHCGPRLSIVEGIPYDRAMTTMAAFPRCEDCLREYCDPADRQFHAEAIACPTCGPRAALVRLDGRAISHDEFAIRDDVDMVANLIEQGEIVAIKGLGGYQLTCDATNADAVARLRAAKRRDAKPFALMARDTDVARRFCRVDPVEEALLISPEAPIVLLDAIGPARLPDAVAPGLNTLGFMLPTTPLHLLIVRHLDWPVVMTSGNVSDEPQVIDDAEARMRLRGVASHALIHDRKIASRVDDSVVRVMGGKPRLIRRARGYAPAPVRLPDGMATAPDVLAFGGELKAAFCLVKGGEAILSQHQGDLEEPSTFDDYCRNLELYGRLFDHQPAALAADRHPEYLSTKLARVRAAADGLPLVEVQHHHAHVAACLAENSYPLDARPVLGIVLDGLGFGDDGTIWGGEFLAADYRGYERLAALKPVAMPGGAQAVREPWRNLYAHLMTQMSWAALSLNFAELALHQVLAGRPRAMLDAMIRNGINAPPASSCGRLFDAVAAALGICGERQGYEGEAAARLEAIVDVRALKDEAHAYPFTVERRGEKGLPLIDPGAMWSALLGDLVQKAPAPVVAACFHKGFAKAVVAMAKTLARGDDASEARFDSVALSGGCFQNRVLFEEIHRQLEAEGYRVLSHSRVPANDGGLALGQAAIAAATLVERAKQTEGDAACASVSPA